MIRNDTPPREQTEALRVRLAEAEEMLRAIRRGEIDALVVEGPGGNQVYTLHSAEEPYRDLVEQMQEGAVVLTPRGDVLYANARFAALVGEPLESVVGGRIDRFVDPSHRDDFEAFLVSGSGRRRSRLIGAKGDAFEASLSLATATSPGGVRLNLIVTDLSELLEATTTRDRAERDNRTKDQFLAMMAHELRTPIAAIGNAVRVLEANHATGDSASRAHEVISHQVATISQMIADLLDVERVVSGKIRLNRQPLDLAAALRSAVATFTDDPGLDRDIEIRTEPVWVEGDARRVEQILANMLANAVKYTPAGGRIRVGLCSDGGDAVLSVEDTGVGISPRLLPFIFDLYVQADRTLDRAQGGLGIGLTLVRRLVDLHGGTIVAASAGEGCGSRFTVRLKQVGQRETPSELVRPERRAKSMRVLVIEDSRDAREMLRMVLELAGHVVYDAPDGVRGLELVNAVRPEVGIIDIGLPAMDGYQIARQIREKPYGRGMLLLALSGYDPPDAAQESLEHGFDYHLVKPVDPDYLARLIGDRAEASHLEA